MSKTEELKDLLCRYSTHKNYPAQVEEAYSVLRDRGEAVLDVLIWGLQQGDTDLELLVMQLLQHYYTDATKALPALRSLIRDDEERLVRVTAIHTANELGDSSEELSALLEGRVESMDPFEQLVSACGLWRTRHSENAHVILKQFASGDRNHIITTMAREVLDRYRPR